MLKVSIACVCVLFVAPAFAQSGGYGTGSNSSSHGTRGYTKDNGTYVQPYQSTNPNSTQTDNFSTKGNTNPYTGQSGTRTPQR